MEAAPTEQQLRLQIRARHCQKLQQLLNFFLPASSIPSATLWWFWIQQQTQISTLRRYKVGFLLVLN